MRKVKSIFMLLLVGLMSFSLQAGPGIQVTAVSVNPQEAPKVAAALAAWMEGAGKDSGSRLHLHQHVADGADPATHSIVSVYPSMAAAEAFSNKVGSDESMMKEWQAFLGKVVPVSRITATSRSAHVNAWGDVNDEDQVWLVHSFSATDLPSVYRALDAWMQTDTGKKFPGQSHLFATIAGGANAPSTTLALGFKSMAEMENWRDVSRGSAGLRALLSTLQAVTEYHGASLARNVGSWGESTKSILKR